jgi:hypothetical protein
MHPEHLIRLLTSLSAAADVIEALDDPRLQTVRGWDLARWRYEPVPWGVRFLHRDGRGRVDAEVLAVGAPAGAAGAPVPAARTPSPWPTTYLTLG